MLERSAAAPATIGDALDVPPKLFEYASFPWDAPCNVPLPGRHDALTSSLHVDAGLELAALAAPAPFATPAPETSSAATTVTTTAKTGVGGLA
jgi:hypothetical protein